MPRSFQQMAGLACYYDTNNWVYLRVSLREDLGKTLAILTCDNGRYDEPLDQEVAIPQNGPVFLRVDFDRELFRFSFSIGQSWTQIGQPFQSAQLSDEHCGGLAFTGTFLCLCVQDLTGERLAADFDYFDYWETR